MLDVEAVRSRFPALSRPGPGGMPFVYADAPGGSQVPVDVIEEDGRRFVIRPALAARSRARDDGQRQGRDTNSHHRGK